MSRYLSILRRDIREFMANSTYQTFAELQANARKREIELETQTREEAESQGRDRRPVQSQPVAKWAKPADPRPGSQRGRTCGKCGKSHDGVCRAGSCYKCGKEGIWPRIAPRGLQSVFTATRPDTGRQCAHSCGDQHKEHLRDLPLLLSELLRAG